MTTIINSFSEISDKYDIFMLDQWGVMHDGNHGYEHAIEAVNKLIKKNKKLMIISNSSKRKISSINSLKDLGFDIPTFSLAKKLLLEKKGDNNLLTSLKKFFESKGFIFFNWTRFCKELFAIETNLTKIKPTKIAILNLNKIQNLIDGKKINLDSQVNLEVLKKANIINNSFNKIKILGSGEIKSKLNLSVNFISKTAKEKLEKAGGTINLSKKN